MTSGVHAGVDGCPAGWIAVVHEPGAAGPRVSVSPRFDVLLAALPDDAIVAVDMPIGLPERIGPGGRGPERAIRPFLGDRQSSVFSIPARAAVFADDYRDACRIAFETSDPSRRVSKQAFHIFPKIREIDAVLRTSPSLAGRIIESHPELAFWELNGHCALARPKKIKGSINADGMAERRALLGRHGYPEAFLAAPPPRGAKADDFLDAAAVALVARRRLQGIARPYPDPPLADGFGLPVAIWA